MPHYRHVFRTIHFRQLRSRVVATVFLIYETLQRVQSVFGFRSPQLFYIRCIGVIPRENQLYPNDVGVRGRADPVLL